MHTHTRSMRTHTPGPRTQALCMRTQSGGDFGHSCDLRGIFVIIVVS